MYISSQEWLIKHNKRKLPYFFNETPIVFINGLDQAYFSGRNAFFLKEAAFEKYNNNNNKKLNNQRWMLHVQRSIKNVKLLIK